MEVINVSSRGAMLHVIKTDSCVRTCMLLNTSILILERLRQEDHEFKTSLGNLVRHGLKNNNKRKRKNYMIRS